MAVVRAILITLPLLAIFGALLGEADPIFGSLFAAVGGAIGAAYFKKDVPPALGGPINPPPIP